MKRVLSLVLALVLVFGAIVPAFAEETTTKTSGEMLKGYGLIEGTDEGLAEDKPLTRAEMAVILAKLYGKAEEAKTYALPSSFTDVDKDAWYAPWVAYAQAQKWMVGDGKTFRPTENLSVQEINVLMVKVLGYEAEWATANEKAEELKVAVTAADKSLVLRGEIFKAMTTTLDQPKKDGTESLGTVLALTGYVAPVPPTPEKLEVAKVMTDNTKTVVIEFNQEVDKKTVTATTVKVTGKTGTVTLAEDMKTATIVLGTNVDQSTELEVHVKGVKTADAKEVVEYKVKHVANDVTVPVITGVEVVDAKHVKVMASEPMNWAEGAFTVLSGVKIDDGSVIAKVVADHVKHEYTIEFNTVKAAGTYKLAISGQKDFAGLAAVKKEYSFDVAKDETAPVATAAVAKSVTEVEVTFDEPLQAPATITINGKATTEAFKADSNNKVVVATLAAADKLTLGATVEVVVAYKGQKDVVGNEVKTSTNLTFKVEDDTTLPTATVAVKAGNKMVFTFSKAMDTTLGKISVLDKDKKVKKAVDVNGLGTWNAAKTELTVVATDLDVAGFMLSDTNPVAAFLQLKDMKDSTVRANLLATVDLSVNLLDTKKPTVSAYYVVKNGTKTGADLGKDDTITFFFSEAMDEDTLKNLSNYLKNANSPLSAISGVAVKSVATDGKSITITYPQARALTVNAVDQFTVIALKDAAGNMSITKTGVTMSAAGVALATITSSEAATTTQVKVTFPVDIKSIDPAAIAVYKGATAHSTVSSIAKIDGAVVTLNLVNALTTDAAEYKVKVVAPTLIKSVYDATFSGTGAALESTVQDKIAPTVAAFNDGEFVTSAIVAADNKAVITFSEPIVSTTVNTTLKNFITMKLTAGAEVKYLATTDYTLALDNSGKALEITLNAGIAGLTSGTKTLEFKLNAPTADLDDNAANQVAVFTKEITDFKYDTTKLAISTATLAQTSATNVMLATTKEFTVTMSGAYAGAFGNTVTVEIVAADLGGSGTDADGVAVAYSAPMLTISLDNNGGAAAYTVQTVIDAVNAVSGFSAAVSGSGVGTTALAATDLEAAATTATSGGTDVITVTFDEAVEAGDVTTANSNTDFALEDASAGAITMTATTVETSTTVKTITVTAADKLVTGGKINAKATLSDVQGNTADPAVKVTITN